MNSKKNLLSTLNHRNPDKIVVDFGSTSVTGIHILTIEKLRNFYGLEHRSVKVIEPYQMLGKIEDDLAEILGIDTIGLYPQNSMFGFKLDEEWKEFKTFWGQTVLVSKNFNTSIDENGDLLIYPEGDVNVPASGKMPKSGYFFDAIIRQDPIDESKLDPEDNLEEYTAISEEDLQYWEKTASKIKNADKGVIATFGGTALGDIALVPGLNVKHPKGVRDIAEWYASTLIRPDYIEAIFDRQSQLALENLSKIYQKVGNGIDVMFICGTDFGTQNSLFCDQDTFKNLYLPYYRRITDWVHENTNWKVFKHSCGAVEPLMEYFIDAGFDIINPVQINAAGMDPKSLKEKYGDRLTFWGGGVDTQKVLSFGSTKDVENQVTALCDIFSKDGGFVFNTVHNIQANVPVENIDAMIQTIRKFNGN